MTEIISNYNRVLDNILNTLKKTGRKDNNVELIVVSKKQNIDDILTIHEEGQIIFGENKVQELLKKKPQLPGKISWHLIGHLQSNKIKKILPHVSKIHSVSSIKLAQQISTISQDLGTFPKVLLQVNIDNEPTKTGFDIYELENDFEKLLEIPRIEIEGLMIIPPFNENPEDSRKYFIKIRKLKDSLEKKYSVSLPELSMGMSNDYEIAIQEGATIIRIGSEIFGQRN